VAGLGNIYVCEALYRARLSPKRMASTIATKAGAPNERAERLVVRHQSGCSMTRLRPGGLIAARSQAHDGDLGHVPTPLSASTTARAKSVQRPRCGGTVKRIVQNGPLDVLLSRRGQK